MTLFMTGILLRIGRRPMPWSGLGTDDASGAISGAR
jgi:hypothetical protein